MGENIDYMSRDLGETQVNFYEVEEDEICVDKLLTVVNEENREA